jgi:HSP20 family molecular chaperone IbpA
MTTSLAPKQRTGHFWDNFLGNWDLSFPQMTGDSVKVDVGETPNEVFLYVDVPGFKKDEVKLNVENGYLTINGERISEKREEERDKNKKWIRTERSSGSFSRSFSLGNNFDVKKITATQADGVLTVTIPKHSGAGADRHDIKIDAKISQH